MSPEARGARRLLTFEVAGAVYALPIASVLEVAEAGETTCVPTLPVTVGGVINHHGNALPVLRCAPLLDLDDDAPALPAHVLVISDRVGRSGILGLPVDRVLGLVDGDGSPARGPGPVSERRTIDGRVASVLDARRLVARARELIERSSGREN
jgi:chemotaxis signal transduction protein